MPTYEYRREDGTTFEVFQRMSEDALTVDPETGQKVTRVIGGGAGLIFKGDGFYLTDYARKDKGGKSGERESDPSSSSESSSSSASESTAAKSSKSESTTTSAKDD